MTLSRAVVLLLATAFAACGDDKPPAPDGSMCDNGMQVTPPAARAAVAGGIDPLARSLYVFGGDTGPPQPCTTSPHPTSDTWRYDLICRRWIPLSPSLSPPARSGAAFLVETTSSRRRLIVFGGRTGGPGAWRLLNDLWALDLVHFEWQQLTPTGTPPPARADGAATFHSGRDFLILFGGNATADPGAPAQPLGDLWFYDLDQNQWIMQAPPMVGPQPPAPRLLHSMAFADSLGLVFVGFGAGANAPAGPYFNDLYAYDIEMNKWRTAPNAALPSGRINASMVFSQLQLILFGGRDEGPLGFQNDLLAYAPTPALGWRVLRAGDEPGNVSGQMCARPADFVNVPSVMFPPPERREAALLMWDIASNGDVGYLYGGRGDCGNLDDVQGVVLSLGWAPLTPATTGLSCAHSGRTGCQSLCQ